eukprot:CAMPEP_0172721230 /NCGR_PEP_ID=MMETSP1074-20121228/78614_1 /TAXON_ID=2916 /ORGANISM="Ceratium fusus, Strain PA161109" /LENGTH=53 /DNA_ID=CAMNT_0013546921 /DNA_START=147 /DNA_END=304 /DNA_ORIENTATION=-
MLSSTCNVLAVCPLALCGPPTQQMLRSPGSCLPIGGGDRNGGDGDDASCRGGA